jgi:preprotein translocase subunit SecE
MIEFVVRFAFDILAFTSVMVLIMVVIAAIFFFVVDAGLSLASRFILAIGQ